MISRRQEWAIAVERATRRARSGDGPSWLAHAARWPEPFHYHDLYRGEDPPVLADNEPPVAFGRVF